MFDGLSRSKVVCAFLSRYYENSARCKRELCFAADREMPIVPTRLDCGPFTWSSILTAGSLYVDFSEGSTNRDQRIAELVTNIHFGIERHGRISSRQLPFAPPQPTEYGTKRNAQLSALLKPTNVNKLEHDIDEVHRRSMPGTREWLLQDVRRWAHDSFEHSASVFWLAGLEGTGKTVIAAHVINQFRDMPVLGGYFMCSADRADRNNPIELIHTIAYPLAIKFPSIATHLLELQKTEPDVFTTVEVSRAFEKLIVSPLSELQSVTSSKVVVVLDALDECGSPSSTDRRDFLWALGNVTLPSNLKIFITSRPEIDIRGALTSLQPYEINLDQERNEADLFLFASSILAHKFGQTSREEKDKLLRTMVDKSQGSFLWLYLGTEVVRKAADGVGALKLLGNQGHKSADWAVDGMYSTVLGDAIYRRGDNMKWCQQFRLVIGAIVRIRFPLGLHDLAWLLDLDIDIVEDMLRLVDSLIHIADDQIRPIHRSFGEFMVDLDRCGDLRVAIDSSESEEALAKGCLQLLHTQLKANMCNLEPNLPNSEVLDLPERIETNIPPAIQYASQHWISHLQSTAPTKTILTFLDGFTRDQILNWLEVVSALGIVSATTVKLLDLKNWTENQRASNPKVDSTTAELVYDTCRFIQKYSLSITTSALHVRTDAAHFRPIKSALFQTYRDRLDAEVNEMANCIQTIDGEVKNMALTPDGNILVTGHDFAVKVWDIRTGSMLQTFRESSGGSIVQIEHVAVSSDGRLVVAGAWNQVSDHHYAVVWETDSGKSLHHLEHGEREVRAIAVSANEKVAACLPESVKIWDVAKGRRMFDLDHQMAEAAVFAAEGNVITMSQQLLKVWDASNGIQLRLHHFEDHTQLCMLMSEGRFVTVADGTLRVRDSISGQVLAEIDVNEFSEMPRCLAVG
ncbi:hypothetical protein HDV00_009722 [Rhizophlyctis rosea]|nr:hypothetical protein HDV00_009722 [Rhizophlyctis rosea]